MQSHTFNLSLVLLFVLLGLNASCISPVKVMESGRYDEAIDLCIHKLSGKKKKSEYVKTLETAFKKANEQDIRSIQNYEESGQESHWDRMVKIAEGIERRQRKINPLLPLYDENGYKAEFKFIKAETLINDFKEKFAEYAYEEIQSKLDRTKKTGDKRSAREAYDLVQKVEQYYPSYKNIRDLEQEALHLGRSYVIIEEDPNPKYVMPKRFRDEILRFNNNDFNSLWKIYHLTEQPGITYDYVIEIGINSIEVSPEQYNTRQFTEKKIIVDGTRYVYDENGNVAKDSLGNDIEEPNKVEIRAVLSEILQRKSARVSLYAKFYDKSNSVKETEYAESQFVFENYVVRLLRGDKRAISRETKRRMNNREMPYPPDEDMIIRTANDLKPRMANYIRKNRVVY